MSVGRAGQGRAQGSLEAESRAVATGQGRGGPALPSRVSPASCRISILSFSGVEKLKLALLQLLGEAGQEMELLQFLGGAGQGRGGQPSLPNCQLNSFPTPGTLSPSLSAEV